MEPQADDLNPIPLVSGSLSECLACNGKAGSSVDRGVNRKTEVKTLLPILMAMVYGVSPIDLIPDLIPLIGIVDDALIIPMLLLLALVNSRKVAKARAKTPPIRVN